MTTKYSVIEVLLSTGHVAEFSYSPAMVKKISEVISREDWFVEDNTDGQRMHLRTNQIVSFSCVPVDPKELELQAANN